MLAIENTKQILIVDRDVATVEPLRQKLGEAGFTVRAITDGSAAIVERPPHLLIIDWNVPGYAALDMIGRLRKVRSPQAVRLIILSDLSGEEHVVSGLNLGADDYIIKPFSLREVVARVGVLLRILSDLSDDEHVVSGLNLGADDYITKPFFLREVVARVCVLLRTHSHDTNHLALCCDDLVLEAATNRVAVRGKLMHLRGVEYRLLEFLMSNAGRTFNRAQLLSRVWGGDTEVDERTVDVNVQRLRKILSERGCEARIQTVRGFGYRFAPAGNTE